MRLIDPHFLHFLNCFSRFLIRIIESNFKRESAVTKRLAQKYVNSSCKIHTKVVKKLFRLIF